MKTKNVEEKNSNYGPCKLLVSVAKEYELSTGIVLYQILFWCLVNETYKNEMVFYKNRYWTYLSVEKLYQKVQGIISHSTIIRALKLLVSENLILQEFKNGKNSYSGYMYAISDKCFNILNSHSELPWVRNEVNMYIKMAKKENKSNKKKHSSGFSQLSVVECEATTDITKLSKLSRVNEPLDANAFI